jgi:hypothetical protein
MPIVTSAVIDTFTEWFLTDLALIEQVECMMFDLGPSHRLDRTDTRVAAINVLPR